MYMHDDATNEPQMKLSAHFVLPARRWSPRFRRVYSNPSTVDLPRMTRAKEVYRVYRRPTQAPTEEILEVSARTYCRFFATTE